MRSPGWRWRRRVDQRRQVADGYQQAAAGYDAAHADPRTRARYAVIERPMLTAARAARRVLEIGCGTGRLLAQVDAPVRVGIDIAPAMLTQARTRTDHLVVADGHCLPFAAGSFDLVLASKGVFRYLDYACAFAECARVLAPSGRLLVHQFAARTWSLSSLVQKPAPQGQRGSGQVVVHSVDSVDELLTPAVRAGLRPSGVWLWRPVRFRPYIVPVPTWLPGRVWSHCLVQLDRP